MGLHHFAFIFSVIIAGLVCTSCERETVINAREPETSRRTEQLRILTWSDYVAPSVIEEFQDQTGTTVIIKEFENTDELLSVCQAENHMYDIVIGPSFAVADLRADLQIARLDFQKLVGEEGLQSKFRFHPWDPVGEFSLPYFFGSTIVAYRSDKIDLPNHSFELLFDGKLKGRTAMLSDHSERFALAHLLRGVDIGNFDEAELAASAKILEFYAEGCGGKFLSDKQIRAQLKSGQLWAAHCYNGDAAMIAGEDPAIKYFTPKEGAALWLDVMSITAESRNPEAAYSFINHILKPEVCARNANWVCYAPPNPKAIELMDHDLTNDEHIFLSDQVLDSCSFLSNPPDHANRMISELIRKSFEMAGAKSE